MRTSAALVITGLLLAMAAGCSSGEAKKVSRDQPCGLLTDAEVTAAVGLDVKGGPHTEDVRDGWECRWRRNSVGPDSWELRLTTKNKDGSCYIPPDAVPARDLDATAYVSTGPDAEIAVERAGVCMGLYADSQTPEGNGTGISREETRDLTTKALKRLG